MLRYELKKIFGKRYVIYFLCIMFILNAIFCLYQLKQYDDYLPSDVASDFLNMYIDNPNSMQNEYIIRNSFRSEQNKLLAEQMRLGNYEWKPEIWENKYAPDGYTDDQFFAEILNRISEIESYPDDIQKVIKTAYVNISELDSREISPNSYIYQYQLHIINRYKTVRTNVCMRLEYTRGWSEYFSYDAVNIFIFAMLIILGTVVFAQEKNLGFMTIIRVSKNGRTKTALTKITAMIIVTTGVVFVFTAESWLIFGFFLGYSSPFNAIQVFDKFRLCPYIISIGEYFFITLLTKLLAFILFATVIMMFSVFSYNYAIIYLCGLGCFGVNFLLYTLRYVNNNNALKILNLVSIATVNPLFTRYRVLNILGNVVDYIPFMFATYTAVFIVTVLLIVWKFNRSAETFNVRWISSTILKTKNCVIKLSRNKREDKYRRHSYSLSLFCAELYKTLIASRFIIIILILFFIKLYISYVEYRPYTSYADAVYKEYMTRLAGEITEEKRLYLVEERTMINETLAKQQCMQESYMNEIITFNEYRSYLSDFNYAYNRNEYLSNIENHAAYIDIKAAEGYEAWFVYDTGWKTLLFTGFDWTMYAAILLLFSGTFATEYTSSSSAEGFIRILHLSKYGRRRTFTAKLISSTLISTVIAIVWNVVDWIFINQAYEMPLKSAPLQSIEDFGMADLTMPIAVYLALFYIIRISSSIILTVLVCCLSQILRKTITAMSITVMITLFPALLNYFGYGVFGYLDFTALMRVTPLIINGAVAFGTYTFISLIIVFSLTFNAKRMWNR